MHKNHTPTALLLAALAAFALMVGLAASSKTVHAMSIPRFRHAGSTPIYRCVAGDNSLSINGLLSNGGDIELGSGICSLSHGLVLSVSGTTLNGAGMGLTVLAANAPLKLDVVTLGVNKNLASGMTVSNLTIDGALHANAKGASKIGRGVVVSGGVTASAITNVETRFGLDGFTVAGSNILLTNVYTHGNRHAGIYVGGNSNMGGALATADSDTVTGSRADGNVLDNSAGKTWDNIDFDKRTSRGTVTNNELTGGDILMSCNPGTGDCTTAKPIGPFLVTGNTVNEANPVGQSSIRIYGTVVGAVVSGNTIHSTTGTAIVVAGPVTSSSVDHNTIDGGPTAYGVHVFPLSGAPAGDRITVTANSVSMGNSQKPAYSIQAATHVTLTNNAAHGAGYDTAQAGAGLINTGNH